MTNGQIEEEVQRAIQDMNVTWERAGYGPSPLSVLQRGHLLQQANELGGALWPFALSNLDALVSMLSHAGDDILPQSKLHTLLASIYRLEAVEDLPAGVELESAHHKCCTACFGGNCKFFAPREPFRRGVGMGFVRHVHNSSMCACGRSTGRLNS